MTDSGSRDLEIQKLSEAYNRINESLAFDSVLQAVLDGARSLTGARYAATSTMDDTGQLKYFLVSGVTPEEELQLRHRLDQLEFSKYINVIPGPLRIADFAKYLRSTELSEFQPPVPVSSFLGIPIRYREERMGAIHLANSEPGLEFRQEDEDILVMFAF